MLITLYKTHPWGLSLFPEFYTWCNLIHSLWDKFSVSLQGKENPKCQVVTQAELKCPAWMAVLTQIEVRNTAQGGLSTPWPWGSWQVGTDESPSWILRCKSLIPFSPIRNHYHAFYTVLPCRLEPRSSKEQARNQWAASLINTLVTLPPLTLSSSCQIQHTERHFWPLL